MTQTRFKQFGSLLLQPDVHPLTYAIGAAVALQGQRERIAVDRGKRIAAEKHSTSVGTNGERDVDAKVGKSAAVLPACVGGSQMLLAGMQGLELAKNPGRLDAYRVGDLGEGDPAGCRNDQPIVADGQADGLAPRPAQHEADTLPGCFNLVPAAT